MRWDRFQRRGRVGYVISKSPLPFSHDKIPLILVSDLTPGGRLLTNERSVRDLS